MSGTPNGSAACRRRRRNRRSSPLPSNRRRTRTSSSAPRTVRTSTTRTMSSASSVPTRPAAASGRSARAQSPGPFVKPADSPTPRPPGDGGAGPGRQHVDGGPPSAAPNACRLTARAVSGAPASCATDWGRWRGSRAVGRSVPARRTRCVGARRRVAEHDDVGELPRGQRQLQWARHPFRVDVPLAREPEGRLDQVHEALARGDLDAHDGVLRGLVPPVVPRPRFDIGALPGVQRRSSAVAHDGQLALHDGEPLMQRGMEVLAGDASARKRRQLRDSAALRVLPRQLEGNGALARDRVLQELPGSIGRRSAGAPGSGCDTRRS